MKTIEVRGTNRVITTIERAVRHTRRGPMVSWSGAKYLLKVDQAGTYYIDVREQPVIQPDHRNATILIERALGVMVLTPEIRAWLEANDPKALRQAVLALSVEAPWILEGRTFAQHATRPLAHSTCNDRDCTVCTDPLARERQGVRS